MQSFEFLKSLPRASKHIFPCPWMVWQPIIGVPCTTRHWSSGTNACKLDPTQVALASLESAAIHQPSTWVLAVTRHRKADSRQNLKGATTPPLDSLLAHCVCSPPFPRDAYSLPPCCCSGPPFGGTFRSPFSHYASSSSISNRYLSLGSVIFY